MQEELLVSWNCEVQSSCCPVPLPNVLWLTPKHKTQRLLLEHFSLWSSQRSDAPLFQPESTHPSCYNRTLQASMADIYFLQFSKQEVQGQDTDRWDVLWEFSFRVINDWFLPRCKFSVVAFNTSTHLIHDAPPLWSKCLFMTHFTLQVWGHREDTNTQQEIKSKDFLLSSFLHVSIALLTICQYHDPQMNSWWQTHSVGQKFWLTQLRIHNSWLEALWTALSRAQQPLLTETVN